MFKVFVLAGSHHLHHSIPWFGSQSCHRTVQSITIYLSSKQNLFLLQILHLQFHVLACANWSVPMLCHPAPPSSVTLGSRDSADFDLYCGINFKMTRKTIHKAVILQGTEVSWPPINSKVSGDKGPSHESNKSFQGDRRWEVECVGTSVISRGKWASIKHKRQLAGP